MKSLLWLDDYRNPFDKEIDWMVFSPIGRDCSIIWVKSYTQFIEHIINNGLPTAICFDHDLGLEVAFKARESGMSKRESRKLKQFEKTGYDCAKWLVDYCIDNNEKLPEWNCQSANPVGKDNINALLNNYKNTYDKQN